jgi:hypothetical protein
MSSSTVVEKRFIRRIADRFVRRVVQPSLQPNLAEQEAVRAHELATDRSIQELMALVGAVSASVADQLQAQSVLLEQLDRRLRVLEQCE